MSPDLANEIVESTFGDDKETYKATVAAVAQARKLRPVFMQRQPKAARNKMILEAMSRPGLSQAADNLLRTWLINSQTQMLEDFLDACGVEHENGVVEDLPDTIADDKLAAGIDAILEKHSREHVVVYLHAFNTMNECAWKNLDELLQTDERLQF